MSKIITPTNCPSCSSPLERLNDLLFCRNSDCGARINKRLEHFAKTLGIKGLGAKTIEKLDLADLTEIFYLDREEAVAVLGSTKIVDKLLDEINRAKSASLATVISSFSIPLIGGTAGNKIAGVVRNIDEITLDLCKKAGLGDKAAANLMDWIEIEYAEMKEFLPFTFDASSTTPSNTNGETICYPLPPTNMYLEEYRHFANAVTENIPSPIDARISLESQRVIDEVRRKHSFLADNNRMLEQVK